MDGMRGIAHQRKPWLHILQRMAGQGVNLGYRDVDALIDVLVNARSYGEAWASYPVLKRYQMRRMADNWPTLRRSCGR